MKTKTTPLSPPRNETGPEKAARLAAEQGVKPRTIQELIELARGIWPEGEDVDEFLEEIYRARKTE